MKHPPWGFSRRQYCVRLLVAGRVPAGLGGNQNMRILGIVALCVALAGCAIQRAQIAQDARAQMVGMSKEQVLTCMGPPASKATEGQTEVWAYNSGDGTTFASGSVSGGSFSGVSSSRFCRINLVLADGVVSAVNYQGPTGGLIPARGQSAY